MHPAEDIVLTSVGAPDRRPTEHEVYEEFREALEREE